MSDQIAAFIDKAKAKGLSDDEIKAKMVANGWSAAEASDALDDLVVPPPPKAAQATLPNRPASQPIAVVQNLSTKGFEYSIMFISLWAVAFSVMWMSISFISDQFNRSNANYQYGVGSSSDAFFVTLLLVTFPVFAYMFLRLKREELADPGMHADPSRRKLTQMTQLVSFLTAIGFSIYFIYTLITPNNYSNDSPAILQLLLQTLVAVAIAGGIFVYYWREEHKKES